MDVGKIRSEMRRLMEAEGITVVDFDDPPCGVCGCMNHFCAADCDCCPEHTKEPAHPEQG